MPEKGREKGTGGDAPSTNINESTRVAAAARQQRQAAALRANLKRRKEQQRGRAAKDES